jgi:putative FmdB family regulatory protein
MPTYEYRCPKGHTLEDFQPITAPTERICPVCPGMSIMTRVIGTGAGVIWKGGPPTRRFGK